MNKNIRVITKYDNIITLQEWQKLYGLNASEDQIGKFFFASEAIFARDLRDYGALFVSELLMRVADEARLRWGKPIHVNSFNRNEAKQLALTAQGLRTAKTSPHVVFMAMDLDTVSKEDSVKLAALVLKVGKDLGIKVRVGYIDYMNKGQTFVHVDVTPEYYGADRPRHSSPHPGAWEKAYSIW